VGTASNPAILTTHPYTDNPLDTDDPMALQHILQLRTAVASVRAAAGAGTAVWTNTLTSNSMLADEDITDLRSSLNAAFANLGLTPPSYVDPVLSEVWISRVHIQQLRDLTRAYPEKVVLIGGSAVMSEPYFSPNGDGTKDTTTLTATVGFPGQRVDFRWRVDVRNNDTSVLVRSQVGVGTAIAFVWDGKNGAGVVQPDALYRLEVVDADSLPVVITSGLARLDLTPPTATVTAPADASVVSNIRLAGSGNVAVTGSALDETAMQQWTLERTGNAQSTVTLGSGTTNLSSGTFATWQTLPSSGALANGAYSLKLTVLDKAGNSSTDTVPVTVGHFTASRSAAQANAAAGGTVTYTSVIPHPLHLKLQIRLAGTVIRTLVDGSIGAGTRNDVWDLRTDSLPASPLVADGAYQYIATVTDGAFSLVWDKSSIFPTSPAPTQFPYPKCWTGTGWVGCDQAPASLNFDPYGGVPLRMAYCVGSGEPDTGCTGSTPAVVIAKVTSQLETETSDICSGNCFIEEYQAGGRQEMLWYGLGTGWWNYLADQPRLTVIRKFTSIPDNMTVVYGTAPVITNVAIAPRMFSPPSVPLPELAQTFTLSVTSFNHRQIKATAYFHSMDLGQLLRTITTPLQPDGELTFTWDGRADDPLHTLVAPGNYAVTIIVADENGSQKIVRPIVVVRY
jgi:flagellar hook assembly protein FlgD